MGWSRRAIAAAAGLIAASVVGGCATAGGTRAPASAPPVAESASPALAPLPAPVQHCPSDTHVGDAAIGLCVDASGSPLACRSPESRACVVDLRVARCLTVHGQEGTAQTFGNPVYAACRANPKVGYGVMGATFRNSPAGWGIGGCEVVHVAQGSPAAAAGLVGEDGRAGAAGDIIYGVTVADVTTTVATCPDLTGALQATVPGMRVTLSYDRRCPVLWVFATWRARTTPTVALAS